MRRLLNDELERMKKEVVVANFRLLLLHTSIVTREAEKKIAWTVYITDIACSEDSGLVSSCHITVFHCAKCEEYCIALGL